MKNIVILGSTGSVGKNAVNVASALRNEFRVVGLAANSNLELLVRQARELNCPDLVTVDPALYRKLKEMAPERNVSAGPEAVKELAGHPDAEQVVCAIVGAAGLAPVLAAISAGKNIALATKEVLVMAGNIVMKFAARKKVRIIPVDSEHSAIFQCLENRNVPARVILTASGGPFRTFSNAELENVTLESAMKHPTWDMGPKVTLDSATLMNKALEMVEAHHLFSVDEDRIDVLIHPQSIVHSMVEFEDGVVLAQMGVPDMRFPIQYALTWPGRRPGGLPRLDLTALSGLTFERPDCKRFPALLYASEAIRRGGSCGAVMNAANEVAVRRFRNGEIRFPEIWKTVEKTMRSFHGFKAESLDDIMEADARARAFAQALEV